ncbi:hypothetical protein Tco_0155864 [Tanacetum coccineum]
MEALTTRIDSQFKEIKGDMKEMRDGCNKCGGPHPSLDFDDKLMFHQIIDFLTASHIKYALSENPTIYVSFIKQFWRTATTSTTANGEVELTASIDVQEKTITEASLKRHLKLEDNDGITTLPNIKIFEQLALMGNMKRASKGYSGEYFPLFPTMINAPESSPSRITSSPSLSPQTHPSTSQPQTTSVAKEPAPIPHESPLQSVYSLGRNEGSLSLNELTVLCTTLSKKGRKISKINKDPTISLVQEEGITWFQEDAEIQEINSIDTEILLDVEEPTELVEDQGSGEKVKNKRSAEKRKDKGKTIMIEPEPEQTTIKLKLRQERAGLEAAIRLQEQLNEEESQRIARDAEIARQLQEEINIAGQEKVVAKDDRSHDIN